MTVVAPRLDAELVRRGLARSRARAAELVAAGRTVVSVLHEISLALHADDLIVMDRGQILHFGGCGEPATHRAVEQVFDHRISIHALAGQWVSLPKP